MKNETPIQGHYDTSSVFVAVIGRPNGKHMKKKEGEEGR